MSDSNFEMPKPKPSEAVDKFGEPIYYHVDKPYNIMKTDMRDDLCQMTIENERAFLIGNQMGTHDHDLMKAFSAAIDEGEMAFYVVWYLGGLAATGWFVAVNEEGLVTKSANLWIS